MLRAGGDDTHYVHIGLLDKLLIIRKRLQTVVISEHLRIGVTHGHKFAAWHLRQRLDHTATPS
jgi:hypothetical protein